jgi:hypothetical protein
MLKEEIRQLAGEIHAEVIGNRRHLHANPELSFEEYKTAAFISSRLDELNIPWTELATTGIVATIKGDQPSTKTIYLRAVPEKPFRRHHQTCLPARRGKASGRRQYHDQGRAAERSATPGHYRTALQTFRPSR